MGRNNKNKKKAKMKDVRGYSQGQQQTQQKKSTTQTQTSVSTKTHNNIKNLLGQFDNTNNNINDNNNYVETTNTTNTQQQQQQQIQQKRPLDMKKFISKLINIVNNLEELKFTNEQIDFVCTNKKYDLTTLDIALDYLCLHLNTMELPTLFTDGRLRDSLIMSDTNNPESTLTILKPIIVAKEDHEDNSNNEKEEKASAAVAAAEEEEEENKKQQQLLLLQKQQELEAAAEAAAEKEKQEQEERKKWLLQQYAYEEEHDENENENEEEEEAGFDSKTNEEELLLSPEEQRLLEEEQKLQELENELNNDANNYMRSKVEMKQLQTQLKKLRQQVGGLRKKVEKIKSKRKQEELKKAKLAEEAATDEDEEEEYGGGGGGGLFGDMFGGGGDDDDEDEVEEEESNTPQVSNNAVSSSLPPPDTTNTATTTSVKKVLLDYKIPKGWTGTTPQKKLDEVCKKSKLPKPKYMKLQPPGHQNNNNTQGFRLVVTTTTTTTTTQKKKQQQPSTTKEWEGKTTDFTHDSSIKDYLATQALYDMDSSLQLYQILPPDFRNLWLSWIKQEKLVEDEIQKQHNDAKQQRIDYLMSLITTTSTTSTSSNTTSTTTTNDGVKNNKKKKHKNDDAPTNQNGNSTEEDIPDSWDDDDNDDDYDDIISNTKTKLKNNVRDNKSTTKTTTTSSLGKKMQNEFTKRQSSKQYQKMKQVRDNLPMTSYRDEVLDMIQSNPVTILCAETGAGKTTQCPQYILEQALNKGYGDKCQIICTQPRRVAAISVAERVAEEMCESSIGKLVGYQIRMEKKRSHQTRLLFCTTGVILRQLQDDSNLTGITHVVVDEVHERQQQTDVLLIILRQLLQTTRPDLKVILMSATMDSNLFCSFFHGAPMISVPGRTFPVSNYYLEDLMDATDFMIEEGSRYALRENRYEEKAALWITTKGGEKRKEMVDLVSQVDLSEVTIYPGYKMSTRRSMERVNEEVINYDLIEDVLTLLLVTQERNTSLVAPDGADFSTGSVLVFLPGLGEIKSMTERLEGNRRLGNKQRFEIIPMHSTLSSQDQRRAFAPAKSGSRKIILSTNIAETSVTIPDVVCVIDSGRVREVRRNKRTSTSILVTDWCSKASSKQRAGRAGRVQPGLCLKLYSSMTAEGVMKATSEPELKRVPLEEVCLNILACGFAKNCMDFLNQAPQPPSPESVKAAIDVLYDVGAIDRQTNEKTRSERLTPLGQHLAKLPVDVRLGKMLIFGALFHCIDPVLTIAASLSSQSPFSTFVKDAAVAKARQKAFADPDSDFVTYCNVWDAYCQAAETSISAGRKFCHSNYLNSVALREIGDARRQFLDLLCGIGFVDRQEVMGGNGGYKVDSKRLKSSSFNRHSNKPELVHAVICAGLYPHVAHLEQPPAGDYTMWHKEERLYFHRASVNSSKKRFSNSETWVVFHEKFGTPNRTSVSTTCFVHPFALLLLGGSVVVKYTERLVIVDDWMQIPMAAQIGVILRELRKKVDILLQKMIERADAKEMDDLDSSMIDGIISILVS